MKLKIDTVFITQLKNFTEYSEEIKTIKLYNKKFIPEICEKIFVVNYGNIDIGFITLKENNINIVQFPRICRLSIITLIEALFIVLLNIKLQYDYIYIENVIGYFFKISHIVGKSAEIDETTNTIKFKLDSINNLTLEDITRKKVIFQK